MRVTYNPTSFGISDQIFASVAVSLEHPEGVPHILAKSDHFEVLQPIIGFVPIFMVHGEAWRDANKCLGYEPMHVSSRFLGSHAKDNLFVSVGGVDVSMKESGRLALHADDSTHAPQATDFVLGKVFNGLPTFHTCNPTMEYMS